MMPLAPFRIFFLLLALLGSATTARAGYPIPEPPLPQRVALADVIVIGGVAEIEPEPAQAFPLLRVRGGRRVPYKIARIRVERVLLGKPGAAVIRVGVGPGRAMPTLKEGQTGLFFLHDHPEGSFRVLSGGWDFIDSGTKEYAKVVALVGRCAGLLADTDKGLQSADGEDRVLTAGMLLGRFRTVRYAYAGAPKTEPIDPVLSRRILKILAEDSLAEKAAREPMGRLTLFFRLGVAEKDGWKPPRRLPEVTAAARKWLDQNADTYRIQAYVPDDSMPVEEDPGPPSSEEQPGPGGLLHMVDTAIRRRPWILLLAGVLALLAVLGWLIARQVRGEIQRRRAEEAVALSLRLPGRGPLLEARKHLASCLKLSPKQARLHFLMAQVARRAGDLDEASQHLRQAEQLGWVPEAIELERGLSTVQQGDLERLEPVLASFIERDHPDKLLILEALVQGCRRSYRLPRALAWLEKWLKFQPDNVRALLWRGETLILLGKNQEALEAYQEAIALAPEEDEIRLKLAELYLVLHQVEDAQVHFQELLKHRPDQPEALLGLARCHAEKGNTTEAATLLDRLLALEPNHASALAEHGRIALDSNRLEEAEKWLRQAVKAAPFERTPLYHLTLCLTRNSKKEEAEECQAQIKRIDEDRKRLDELKSAIMVSPRDASLRCEMGVILLRNGQDKEGVRWLESALREDPGDEPARKALDDHARRPANPAGSPAGK
jgi:tetratricopeptide (TPR) repeat protein